MSHDFDEKHGGRNGPCNGQGIMSYGSVDYNEWSTCSKSDFQEHYVSQYWGGGSPFGGGACLKDISGSIYLQGILIYYFLEMY